MSELRGIAGLSPREPIGAALTIGRKGPKGNPIEKDRFHIVLPTENADRRRPAHPRYRAFNDAPAERRRSLICQIVHSTRSNAFEHYLSCFRGRTSDPVHPAGAPFCRGDGVNARRFVGGDGGDGWADIPCLNDKCEYRTSTPAACKPFARFLFRVVFRPDSGLPSTTVKYTSSSWYTVANLAGFWDSLESSAAAVGAAFNPIGYRFMLQLEEKRSTKHGGSRFPVVSAVPLDDPFEFFGQMQTGADPHAARLTDDEQRDAAGADRAVFEV